MKKTLVVGIALVFSFAIVANRAASQTDATAPQGEPVEDGIPVTNQLVITKCGTCHARDLKGNLSRISWERTTPEGWDEAIRRMVRSNGLVLNQSDWRSILKYLATDHGLAPEEAKPVMFLAEHRSVDESEAPKELNRVCNVCHAYSRALSWRRSRPEWHYLKDMHMALFITAASTFRRPDNATEPSEIESDSQVQVKDEPGDVAMDYLAKAAPLNTPEWSAWRARLKAPHFAGKWLVTAYLPGRGKYFGQMVVDQGAAEDEFTTSVKLKSAADGSVITRTGSSIVYAGYAWRGKSKGTATAGAAPNDLNREAREALWFSPDQNAAEGRWYWGDYQEFGYDVKLLRASGQPTLYGADVYSLKAGSIRTPVRLFVDDLPLKVSVADIDFGAGVTINRIISSDAGEVVVEVSVAADALFGKRDIRFGHSTLANAIAVYDHLDYIKVTPQTALARLGSEAHPKGYLQFEATGYNRGADGKLGTPDDIDLGPADVTWSVEEFYATFGDDDKSFVGQLTPTALFIPASDGPNPERKFSRNNYGDVWVVATSNTDKDPSGKPIAAKSYLVVTVPTYMKWDQPEVNP